MNFFCKVQNINFKEITLSEILKFSIYCLKPKSSQFIANRQVWLSKDQKKWIQNTSVNYIFDMNASLNIRIFN